MRKSAKLLWFMLGSTVFYVLWIIILRIDSRIFFRSAEKRKLMIVEYYYENRTGNHCNTRFDWGEMCPKLYTELGGRCDLINGTFDCPDIRNNSLFTLRQGQLVITRMLRMLDLLAQQNNLTYWLAYGTLLGAARHHGFIPWDNDADIFMPLEDYVKFFQSVAKDLPAGIFFQNVKSDLALQPSDEDIAKHDLHTHETVGIYERTWNPRLRDTNSCYRYCFHHNCKWHDGLMVDIFVTPRVGYSVYPLKLMPFEGFLFPVPNNWRNTLASEYGNNWFEFSSDTTPHRGMDTLNGCEKLKS